VNETAVAAALAVARAQRLRCDDPVVLRDAWHVLVHLRPSQIVARVSTALPFPEGPNPDDIERELAIALHAARAGAPVVPRRLASRGSPAEGQALHGDAHLGNCMASPAGPLWHDFETACRGPREYDLAALGSAEALAAYGGHDSDLADEMLVLYLVWVTASMLVALPRRPELTQAVERRLDWLRRR
jgi:hypothetical protein